MNRRLDALQVFPALVVLALGVLTGGLSNVTSGGAGVFTIYFLTTYVGLAIQDSTGTVLAASTIIVLIGAISFYRKGGVDVQLALTVGVSGVVGAFAAARWASTIHSSTLESAFGGFTLAIAFFTAYRFVAGRGRGVADRISANPTRVTGAGEGVNSSVQEGTEGSQRSRWAGSDPIALTVQIAKGVAIGVATGLFGVGLASLSVVLFMLLFKLDTKTILGTSLFASFFRYLGGSVGYLTTGEVDPFYFSILAVGGAIGSIIGAKLVLRRGGGSRDVYIKGIVIGILLFISYEFLLKRII